MEYPIRELASVEFPALIREITDPPAKLYLRGTLPSQDMKWLCVVGSRKYSPYGKAACTDLIQGLRGYPVVIVSGLALGMDGIAHEAALSANLPTVAVPGSGLHDRVIYPRSHFPLSQRILKAGGALLSEFEPGWVPRLESFPQRNRIMAGLSHAVLVVEANERSGTLITSRLATEYNRDVLTIPHPISSPTGSGPHLLMKIGATPIRTSEDILEALQIDPSEHARARPSDLSDTEKIVLDTLSNPMTREELVARLNMPIREANVLLGTLELKQVIEETGGVMRMKK
jgi:DNA processing protein